ncbi:MAG: SIMPL domain-containing protein [Candidatus Pacebacteria bacterium]|nr:SIMPL domain-containing protein [Candidatus Paceibacterota bacterium]
MFDISNRLYKIIAGFLAVLAVYFCFEAYLGYATLPQNNIYPEMVSITGEGKASVSPDVAKVNLGITTEGTKIETIVLDNTTKMNALLGDIKTIGIESKDITTKSYSLQPRYEWDQNGKRISRGYTLSQSIEVKIRDFTKIGQVLEIAANNEVNNIGDLQFTIDDLEKAKAEARTKAIAQAKAKAQVIAAQTGIKLKKLSSIYEDSGAYPYPMYDSSGMGGAMTAKEISSIAPTIQTGEQEITVRITLNYRVK